MKYPLSTENERKGVAFAGFAAASAARPSAAAAAADSDGKSDILFE